MYAIASAPAPFSRFPLLGDRRRATLPVVRASSPRVSDVAAQGDSQAQIRDAKSKLVGLCEAVRPFGRKATPEQMKEIEDAAMALREVAAGSRYDGREIEESWLQGTHDMLYNTNEGPGGGRFGPILAAELSQTIEGYPGRMTLRGVIVPWLFSVSTPGSVQAVGPRRVRVDLETMTMSFFGGLVKKEVPVNKPGSWDVWYIDEDTRLFKSNLGNLEVTRKRTSA